MADHSVDRETASHGSGIPWAFGLHWIPGSARGVWVGVGQLIGFDWAESSFQHFWLSPEKRELSVRKRGGVGGWRVGVGGVKGTWEKP